MSKGSLERARTLAARDRLNNRRERPASSGFAWENRPNYEKPPPNFSSKTSTILNHSFETQFGPASRPGTRPTRGWNWAGLKKNMKRKNSLWLGGLTRQDTVKNPVATRWLFFFTKTTSFWFKKKIWPGRPGQNPEPRSWIGPGLKTMFWII
jgi:hypothetical protein